MIKAKVIGLRDARKNYVFTVIHGIMISTSAQRNLKETDQISKTTGMKLKQSSKVHRESEINRSGCYKPCHLQQGRVYARFAGEKEKVENAWIPERVTVVLDVAWRGRKKKSG